MKPQTKGAFLLLAVVFILLALPFSCFLASTRDYVEAEPLVEVIWPMACEMKRFSEEHGRSPSSLDEIARFSADHDFSALRRYPHEFSTSGTLRFSLRVNRRYGFSIDEDYTPAWIFPGSVVGRTKLTISAKPNNPG